MKYLQIKLYDTGICIKIPEQKRLEEEMKY